MIERKFIESAILRQQVEEFIGSLLKNSGISKVEFSKTPIGEKITIFSSKPGLIVGKRGENIQQLTELLKGRFGFDNPVVEIAEVEQPLLDARIVAERVCASLEKWGTQRFKAIAHRALEQVLAAGAKGAEIIISGKLPSARAKSWRFAAGYMIKRGAGTQRVRQAVAYVNLKPGTFGVKVAILPNA